VSYNIANTNLGGSSSSESQRAQTILNNEFPSEGNSSNIILVIQNSQIFSDQVRQSLEALNSSLFHDASVKNYTGMTSVFETEFSIMNSTLPTLAKQVGLLASNVSQIASQVHFLEANLTLLNSNIFLLNDGLNQTAQLVYGIPSLYVSIWQGIVGGGTTNPYVANSEANKTIYNQTSNFGGSVEEIGYYTVFFKTWNGTFSSLGNATPALSREQFSINETVPQFTANLNASAAALFDTAWAGLNVTNWNSSPEIANLTITSFAAGLPSSLTSTLGVSAKQLSSEVYNLGRSPSSSSLGSLSVSLIQSSPSFTALGSPDSEISISQLIRETYGLGYPLNSSSAWMEAAKLISNATTSSFASSPLFQDNYASLNAILSKMYNLSNIAQIRAAIGEAYSSLNYSSYPFVLSKSITKSLVSSDNQTMLVLLNFSFQPDRAAIDIVRNLVQGSFLSSIGKVYVTGGPVVDQDVSDVFGPALFLTVIAGVLVSILIVGLLFLSPITAIVPLLLGGIAIGIALPAIYLSVVVAAHENITFLTPTLTTLLMLGLAVDYSVLQLRRTREERLRGSSKEQSVSTSVRWAGEAVLTAGITVIVAYIVMWAANVPLFSGVGAAIALGVSILLAASLTLLPSMELALGDRLFWPSLSANHKFRALPKVDRQLDRITRRTLRHKVLVIIVIGLVALGSLYVVENTPSGVDLLKLIPNFQSNQGLTIITDKFGGGTIAPTVIVLTTQSPIVHGNNVFNLTLLNLIDLVTATAASTPGVSSVISPTRPFGSAFDYSLLSSMAEPERSQYLSAVLSQIGRNNETALIIVGLSYPSQSSAAVSSLLDLEAKVRSVPLLSGISVVFGGATQSTYDSQSFLNGILPEVVLILSAAVYVILFLQLRSAFTPIRLVFTILCSVAMAIALLSLTFYYALRLPIFNFAPLFVVVTMLGVGIDYDIFFVTRIREEVIVNGKSDNDAIKTAITKVWVTILGLGLVLASVFGSLLLVNIQMLREISLAVSAAILIDTTVVILFFVPALMGLAQHLNWWPSSRKKGAKIKQQSTV
jgi:RND superfamily putative drug exporter